MADEKKKATTSEVKSDKEKKPSKFSPKRIGKGIARFFKDLRGETKKIVWPGRQMVLKSTGVVLAAIIVIGAGIWLLDFAVSGGITAVNEAAEAKKAEATATTVATTAAPATTESAQTTAAAEESTSDTSAEDTTVEEATAA